MTVKDAIGTMLPAGKSGDALHDLPEIRTPDVMARIKKIPKNGGSRSDLKKSDQLPCHKRCRGFNDIYGRMSWDAVSPTITGGCVNPSKGRFLHPEEDRAITLREAAILQTFPKDYRFHLEGGKGAVATQIGNALPPEFIRRHALQIKTYLTRKRRGAASADR
jgi:DNA (cytosine-5)-methyltransferase 1